MNLNSMLRGGLRLANRAANPFGVLISKPELIHGSPRFSGATLWSRRLFQLRHYFKMIENVEGDVAESGVQWGYGILAYLHLIAEGLPRKIYGFDSFQGHSEATDKDRSGGKFVEVADSFRISQDDVWKTLRIGSTHADADLKSTVELVPGWIQDTMPIFRARAHAENIRLAYVSCDPDFYEPIRATLENVWPSVVVGGLVMLGGLNNPELMGKTIAVHEFLATIDPSTYEILEVEIRDHGYVAQTHSILRKRP